MHETGRRGSKINISWIKIHNFFVPELMAATVVVKASVFLPVFELVFLFFAMFEVTRWENLTKEELKTSKMFTMADHTGIHTTSKCSGTGNA